MGFIAPILCGVLGHRWHPLSWRSVPWDWAHLWRGYADAWRDHPTSWGIVGLFDPYDDVSSHVCGRCGRLRKAGSTGGIVHLKVLGDDTPEHPRPLACAGALTLATYSNNDPFRKVR